MAKIKVATLSLLVVLLLTSFKIYPDKKQYLLMGFGIVELFTSEGDASCPAADETLIHLSKEFAGKPVYLLSFHVDYWDNKGWKDPYSDREFTERQHHYNQLLHTDAYTPQAIFNGKQEMIGSETDNLRTLIKASLKVFTDNVISIGAAIDGNRLTVNYQLHSVSDDEMVNIALVQERVTDKVTAGANKGTTISNVNVVRVFKTINAGKITGATQLTIPPDMEGHPFRIIAYIQSKSTWKVIAGNTVVISTTKTVKHLY
ncbi:DUF1223 domain-containing protein [Mucilaginibacter jinjuensis]|uniref:DUF1223 domain-containing protein n=1 Tax=Mucilaginibacter jinjuensis TaxID=1176721 RepID=A0ABY7TDA9_9SPHI|nr:DUF1223 domain-containing protein [Mucilaginibacter jinjuensis]WCT14510.1 DUF1223 domain-containing protein [Mucilaginibacter jinjuensis]